VDVLLIIGGSGLLGSKIAAAGRDRYKVIGTYRSVAPEIDGVAFVELCKERVEEGLALVRKVKPAVVIDTAAFHNVDMAEERRELAWQVNAGSTGSLARAATDLGARYLFVSTDFVFDGAKGHYAEDDVPRPVNHYGKTKLAGEEAVLAASAGHIVVRPSVIYGWDDTRLNFATWVLTSLRAGQSINVVTDWIGSPTLADGLAACILQLLSLPDGGIYHLAGADAISRYEFAVRLAKAFGPDDTLIKPVRSADLGMKARRPPDSSLTNNRAKRHRITVVAASDGIKTMKAQRSLESFVPPARFKS